MENKQELRELIKKALEPTFNKVIETVLLFTTTLEKSMPESMPDTQKLEFVEAVLKQQSETIVHSLEAGVPEDFEQKVKEAVHVEQ